MVLTAIFASHCFGVLATIEMSVAGVVLVSDVELSEIPPLLQSVRVSPLPAVLWLAATEIGLDELVLHSSFVDPQPEPTQLEDQRRDEPKLTFIFGPVGADP